MKKFKLIGKPLLVEKYVEGKRKNNAKFSGQYVRPRTHNVRVHALRSYQFISGDFNQAKIFIFKFVYFFLKVIFKVRILKYNHK